MFDIKSAEKRLRDLQESTQFISLAGLETLANHKYKSGVYTYLDLLFYKIWWEPVAAFVPSWMAPNLITFIGFIVAMTNIPLLVLLNPTLDSTLPSWVFAYAGSTVFFYITMDAIDGMQARKTKSSSPLGQLFDHGCDCSITTVFSLMMINGLGLGPDYRSLLFVSAIQVAFFLSQWEEKYTGVCRTSVGGVFGVTEMQLLLMSQMFITAVNPSIGSTAVYPGWTYTDAFLAVYFSFVTFVSVSTVVGILIRDVTAYKELLSIVLLNGIVVSSAIFSKMHSDEYVLAILAMAFCNSFSTIRVILSSITHTPFPLTHSFSFPLFIIVIVRSIIGYGPWIRIALALYLGGLLDHIVKNLINVANEISCYLGIQVFRIGAKKD